MLCEKRRSDLNVETRVKWEINPKYECMTRRKQKQEEKQQQMNSFGKVKKKYLSFKLEF